MSLHDDLAQRLVAANETLQAAGASPETKAAGRAGFDHILVEAVLALASEMDTLKARVAELEAEQ